MDAGLERAQNSEVILGRKNNSNLQNLFKISIFSKTILYAGMPEWPNGMGLGPIGLVPTQVQTLFPAFYLVGQIISNVEYYFNIRKLFIEKGFLSVI